MQEVISRAELEAFAKLLEEEEKTVTIYKESARGCTDLGLKELYEDLAQRHKEHYAKLLQELKNSAGEKTMCNVGEKDVLQDGLDCEKRLSQLYMNCVCECVDLSRKNRLMQQLEEEQDVRLKLYGEMQKRGWGSIEAETPEKILQVSKRFFGDFQGKFRS